MQGLTKIVIAFTVACLLLATTPVRASDNSQETDNNIENDPACRTLNYFLVGAAMTLLPQGGKQAITAGLGLAGIGLTADAIQAKCEEEVEDFIDYYERNPINYNDFVRQQCYGNPFACPGNLSTNPASCNTFIVCSPYMITGRGGLSIADVISAITHIDMAYQLGSWEPVLPPPDYQDPY